MKKMSSLFLYKENNNKINYKKPNNKKNQHNDRLSTNFKEV